MNKKLFATLSILILGIVSVYYYLAYRTQIPTEDFITISMCGFGCDNNMLFDLNTNEVSIYFGFYNRINLLSNRELTQEEINKIREIFNSKEYLELPEFNMKVALDAEQISITSNLNGQEKNISHIMPEDKTVRDIITLYNAFNVSRE